MDPIYEDFQDMAIDLLDEFGVDIPLLKSGEMTGPPHRQSPGTPTRHTVRAFRSSKTITSLTDPRLTVVKNSYLISTSTGVQVKQGDSLETERGILMITALREVSPVGLTILYIAQVAG